MHAYQVKMMKLVVWIFKKKRAVAKSLWPFHDPILYDCKMII